MLLLWQCFYYLVCFLRFLPRKNENFSETKIMNNFLNYLISVYELFYSLKTTLFLVDNAHWVEN